LIKAGPFTTSPSNKRRYYGLFDDGDEYYEGADDDGNINNRDDVYNNTNTIANIEPLKCPLKR